MACWCCLRCVPSATPPIEAGALPTSIHPESRACTVPSCRCLIAPTVLKIAPWRMSVPTASVGLNPKTITRIGVISEPPPMPVIPTRAPISRPVRTNCQVKGATASVPDPWSGADSLVRLDQHLGHLGTGELDRGQLAVAEHLAHLRPGQEDVVVGRVRAGLRAGHRPAPLAPEGVLEEHRLDVELVRLELVEDQLRVVGAVVAADAGVVAADDEVRAAVVLAADRVPDRLARAGVAHGGRERGDDDAIGGVVVVDEDAVAL